MFNDRFAVAMKRCLFVLILLLWPRQASASPATLLTNDDQTYAHTLFNDIKHAKHTIIIADYVWRLGKYQDEYPNRILAAVIAARARGVWVEVVLNGKCEGEKPVRTIKDLNKMIQSYKDNTRCDVYKANVEVLKRLNKANIFAAFARPEQLAYLKCVIIDDRIVYIGSHNITQSALKYNAEVSVRLIAPKLAHDLTAYINRLIPDLYKFKT